MLNTIDVLETEPGAGLRSHFADVECHVDMLSDTYTSGFVYTVV